VFVIEGGAATADQLRKIEAVQAQPGWALARNSKHAAVPGEAAGWRGNCSAVAARVLNKSGAIGTGGGWPRESASRAGNARDASM